MRRPCVAIVGGSGLVGRALARRLSSGGRWEPVVLDPRPPGLPGVRWERCDVLESSLEELFARLGVRAVMHLVARVDPPRPSEREAMRRLHEEGTRRAVRAARAVGVARFVLCSSAVVYGARPDNPVPLTEEHPRRPNPDFPYAVDKARQEEIVEAEVGDALSWAVARPAIVYARDAKSYLTEILRRSPGVLPAIDGRRPPLQFVHVDDVARALEALLDAEATGPFNVASTDWLPFDEVARLARRRVLPVPRRLIAPVLDALALRVPAWARAPAYIIDYLSYPFVLSVERLWREVGARPEHSSKDALLAMLGR